MHQMQHYRFPGAPGTMLIEPTETESLDSIDRFIDTMKRIAEDARNGKAEEFHAFPQSTPRKRLDEVTAARQPVLKWVD